MNRAKIMLMSIAVLATVGSALAFKVVKKGSTTYCYEQTSVQPSVCTEEINLATAQPGSQVYYYTTKIGDDCSKLECKTTANSFGF